MSEVVLPEEDRRKLSTGEYYQEESVDIKNGPWDIKTTRDGDGHLTVWIKHDDASSVIACDWYEGDGREWAERFSTEAIEAFYVRGTE